MKKYIALLSALLLLLCGCFEKEFENTNLSFKGSDSLDVSVGETKSLTAIMPDNGVAASLEAVSDSDILTVSLDESGTLTLTGNSEGECSITFTLSAEGYKPFSSAYPVRVTLKELEIDASANGTDALGGISLDRGDTVELKISANAENADITVSSGDSARLSVSGSGGSRTLTALSSGSAEITVSAAAYGYADRTVTIPVDISMIPAQLSLSHDSVGAVVGGSAFVTCEYQEGGSISAHCDSSAVSTQVNGDKVTVSSSAAGSYTVTVRCEADDFTAAEQQFTAVFSLPTVTFSAPGSLIMTSGETTSFDLAGYLPDTVFTASSGGRAAVTVSGGRISVTARAAGSDTITVKGEKAGHQSASIKIPVTINSVSATVSTRYKSDAADILELINEERTDRGLAPLSYVSSLEAGCAIRAGEASERWSHTRPDGRDWETVLYDTGVSFVTAGENLLEMNALDPEEAVRAWMDSPGHRENILRPNFNGSCIGIYKDGGYYYYAQHFIER